MKKVIIFAIALIAAVSCSNKPAKNTEPFTYEEYEEILKTAIANGAESFKHDGRRMYIIDLPTRQKGNERTYAELIAVERNDEINFGGETFYSKGNNRKYDFYEHSSVKEVDPEKVDRPVFIQTTSFTEEEIMKNPTWVMYHALALSNAGTRDVKLPLQNGKGTVYLTVEENGTYRIWFRVLEEVLTRRIEVPFGETTFTTELYETHLRTINLHEGDASTMYLNAL